MPVAAIAWMSAVCCPGRLMSLRDDASPESAAGSPATTTVTADAWAALTAAANPEVDVQEASQPCA